MIRMKNEGFEDKQKWGVILAVHFTSYAKIISLSEPQSACLWNEDNDIYFLVCWELNKLMVTKYPAKSLTQKNWSINVGILPQDTEGYKA